MVSGADFFAPDAHGETNAVEIDVWSCHWEIVNVFEACRLDVGGGLAPSYSGISAQEVAAACWLLRVPRAQRREIAEDVQFMGRVVAGALNRRIADQPPGNR